MGTKTSGGSFSIPAVQRMTYELARTHVSKIEAIRLHAENHITSADLRK